MKNIKLGLISLLLITGCQGSNVSNEEPETEDLLIESQEEVSLKEQLWEYYQSGEIETAAKLALSEYKAGQFSEESELYDWYIDLTFLNVLDQVDKTRKVDALKSLSAAPIIVTTIPKEYLMLRVASTIEDPESLVPYAATEVVMLEEKLITDLSKWKAPSIHAEALKSSLDCIWDFKLKIITQNELESVENELTAIVGRMKATGKNELIGYYGDSTEFFKDGHIEAMRPELEQIPVFQEGLNVE